ncbi:MAG: hypothetical protein WC480_02515 [Patescibacteria group bacterium]
MSKQLNKQQTVGFWFSLGGGMLLWLVYVAWSHWTGVLGEPRPPQGWSYQIIVGAIATVIGLVLLIRPYHGPKLHRTTEKIWSPRPWRRSHIYQWVVIHTSHDFRLFVGFWLGTPVFFFAIAVLSCWRFAPAWLYGFWPDWTFFTVIFAASIGGVGLIREHGPIWLERWHAYWAHLVADADKIRARRQNPDRPN